MNLPSYFRRRIHTIKYLIFLLEVKLIKNITNLVREAAGRMLFDAHVDEGAGRGQRGLHLSEAVLNSLKDISILNLTTFF